MSDLDVLARTIYGEARGESFSGQVAVGYVIKTRSLEKNESITNICLAPFQFSCWNPTDPNRKVIEFIGLDNPVFMRCYGIACLVITGDVINPVVGANHYITTSAPLIHGVAITWPPEWVKGMKDIAVIGAHRFLRGN